jgi:hypothetical protein
MIFNFSSNRRRDGAREGERNKMKIQFIKYLRAARVEWDTNNVSSLAIQIHDSLKTYYHRNVQIIYQFYKSSQRQMARIRWEKENIKN